MKQVFCKKNQFTKIIFNIGRGYPQTFRVTISPQNKGQVTGIYKQKRYFWIFPQTPTEGKLEESMEFQRYWENGIYSVAIKPNSDVLVYVK